MTVRPDPFLCVTPRERGSRPHLWHVVTRVLAAPVRRSVVFSLVVVAGCVGPSPSPLDSRLEDGRSVRDLIRTKSPTALIVYNAAFCFACGSDVAKWQRVARDMPGRVVFLFSGPFTEGDRRVIRIKRIPVDGVIVGGPWPDALIPSEFIVENGAILSQAHGLTEVLARRLWNHLSPGPTPAATRGGQ
jgi:hypothetical protein